VSAAFAFFFAAYLLYALVENLRRGPATRLTLVSALLQAPLVLLGTMLAIEGGLFSRDLLSPISIAAGLVLGHVIFAQSLLVTHQRHEEILGHFRDIRPIFRYLRDDPDTLMRVLTIAISEEVIYRAAAQPLLIDYLGSPWLGIAAAAAVFCVVHQHFFQNPLLQSLEFAAFSLVLGALYFLTGSFILVVLIHAVRNIEIAYIEHTNKQIETDQPTQQATLPKAMENA